MTAPAFVSRATLAAELDMSESTVDSMVKRGILPRPLRLSQGCLRWCWADVQAALASLKPGATTGQAIDHDPYLAGVRNAEVS